MHSQAPDIAIEAARMPKCLYRKIETGLYLKAPRLSIVLRMQNSLWASMVSQADGGIFLCIQMRRADRAKSSVSAVVGSRCNGCINDGGPGVLRRDCFAPS